MQGNRYRVRETMKAGSGLLHKKWSQVCHSCGDCRSEGCKYIEKIFDEESGN